ncbi:T9SS type A sorting domain-containing protein [bacterium]|nr:T9SS type A sorting domain-containing protein [bacterium]
MYRSITVLLLIVACPALLFAQSGWSEQTSGTFEDLYDVAWAGEQTAIAVGNNATILRSTDGGESWNEVTVGVDGHMYGVDFNDEGNGTIAGQNGVILFSDDAGETWSTIEDGMWLTHRAVNALPGTDNFYVAGSNSIFTPMLTWTTNNWDSDNVVTFYIDNSEGRINGFHAVDASTFIASCRVFDGSGAICTSSNGGASWSVAATSDMQQSEVAFSGDTGLSVGFAGSAFLSMNGGSSWTEQTFPGNSSSFTDVAVRPGPGEVDHFTLVSSEGDFFVFDPTDQSLEEYATDVTNTLNGIAFANSSVGLIVGNGGMILRTGSGGEPGNEAPSEFNLEQPEEGALVIAWEVEFEWEEALDEDGDDVTYELTVTPDFAQAFSVEILNDTLEAVDFSGYTIEPGEDYEISWDMLATDGTDTTEAMNGPFSFTLRPPLEGPPGPFERLAPEDMTSHDREPIELVWSQSLDPNGWPVGYQLAVEAYGEDGALVYEDEVFDLVDTTHTYNFAAVTQRPAEALELEWTVEAVNEHGTTLPDNGTGSFTLNPLLGTEDRDEGKLPSSFAMQPPYPNPFNSQAEVKVLLPESGTVRVELYDVQGRRVQVVQEGEFAAGSHTVSIDGSSLASGTYFVEAVWNGNATELRRLTLIK